MNIVRLKIAKNHVFCCLKVGDLIQQWSYVLGRSLVFFFVDVWPIFADRIQFRILLTSVSIISFGKWNSVLNLVKHQLENWKLSLSNCFFIAQQKQKRTFFSNIVLVHKLNEMISNKNVNGLDGVFNVLLLNSKFSKCG